MRLPELFQPKIGLSEQEVRRGLRALTFEGIFSNAFAGVTSGGILAAFALALGANNLQIGILVALPALTQPIQVPAILLIERIRMRKLIATVTWFFGQSLWIPIALIPVFMVVPSGGAVMALLVLIGIRGGLAGVVNCSWNGWIRDLVPQAIMGKYFAKRLAYMTIAAAVAGLAGAVFLDIWQNQSASDNEVLGYTFALLFATVVFGLGSPIMMTFIPEPRMQEHAASKQPSLSNTLAAPFRDGNFKRFMSFMFLWGLAANLAVPFWVVYMLTVLDLPLSVVIGLTVLMQVSSTLFYPMWGPMADRLGSKVVLTLSLSLYLLVILAWVFTTMPERYVLTFPLLVVLHIFAGAAAAGVALTSGTLGLKLAPQGEATAYLAGLGLIANLGAGLGPLIGGRFADYFSVRDLSLTFRFTGPDSIVEFPALFLGGFDFLFVVAFLLGLATLNILATVREDGEVTPEVALGELMSQSREVARTFNSVPGLSFATQFPYAYLRRIPGVETAVGATAYQVAWSTRAAAAAVLSGESVFESVNDRVGEAVADIVEDVNDLGEAAADVAFSATRGALSAFNEIGGDIGALTKASVLGTLRGLHMARPDPQSAIQGAVVGAIQGAADMGQDLPSAAIEAVRAAGEAAPQLGISAEDAIAHATDVAVEAAEDIGADAALKVREALARLGADDSPS